MSDSNPANNPQYFNGTPIYPDMATTPAYAQPAPYQRLPYQPQADLPPPASYPAPQSVPAAYGMHSAPASNGVPAAYGMPQSSAQPYMPSDAPPLGHPVQNAYPMQDMNAPLIQEQNQVFDALGIDTNRILILSPTIFWFGIVQCVFLLIQIWISFFAIIFLIFVLCGVFGARLMNKCLLVPMMAYQVIGTGMYIASMIVFDLVSVYVLGVISIIILILVFVLLIWLYRLLCRKS